MELTDINGVGDSMAEKLRDEGFSSVDSVAEANELELRKVEGVGDENVVDLRSSARDVIQGMHTTEDEDENESEEPVEGERPDFVDEDESEEEEVQSLSESQESDEESEDEEDDGPYPLTLSVTDEQFDALESALFYVKNHRQSSNPDQSRVAASLLDEFRSLGGEGERTVELSGDQIQSLYTSLLQFENRYKSGNMMDAYHDISEVREQVDETRQEHLY